MKKLGKILLWTVGIFAGLLVLAIIGIKLFFPVEKVKAMAVERGSAAMGREIAIGDLDISIWGGLGVELHDVQVGNPAQFDGPEFLAAEKIDLKLRLLPLLTGEYQIDRLIVSNPVVNLIKTASGEVNYRFETGDSTVVPAEIADLPPEGQATALAISFDEIEIENGTVRYTDDSSGTRLGLLGVGLSSALLSPGEGIYQAIGRLQIDTVQLTAGSTYPSVGMELAYDGTYNSATDLLTVARADLQLNDLRLKASGMIKQFMAAPTVELGVRSEQNNLRALLSLLSPEQLAKLEGYTINGDFDLDVDIRYASADTTAEVLYTGTASLSGVELTSAEIEGALKIGRCLIDFKPDNLRLTIENGSFDGNPLKGHLVIDDFSNPRVSGELAGSLNLKIIEPFLPPTNNHRLAGQSTFELKIGGPVKEVGALDFSGTLSVTEGRYESDLLPEPISTFVLDAYFDKNLVNIRRLDCTLPSGNLALTGRLTNLVSYMLSDSTNTAAAPSVEATVKGDLDLAIAARYLPPAGHPQLKGNANVDARFLGSMDNLASFRSFGQVRITDASYTDSLLPEPVEHFEAALRLRPDTIEIQNLTALFTSSDITLKGNLIKPFPYLLPILDMNRDSVAQPLLKFEITSHRFDVDRLFPEAVPGAGIDGDSALTSVDSVSTIILPAFEGIGTVTADTVVYSKVELTQVRCKVHILDRKIECYDAFAQVYTGRVEGKTTIDLSDFDHPHYTGSFQAENIEADDFVSRFTPFGGHLFGKCNLTKATYSAVGWEPEAFLNSLTLNGDMDVREGRILTSGPLADGLSQLATYVKRPFKEEQTLRDLKNKISVAGGRVTLDEIVGDLDGLGAMSVRGSYGFDNTLDYAGAILLDETNRRKIGFTGQELALPVSISGTIMKPTVKFDFAELARKVAEDAATSEVDKLKDKAKDVLNGLFKKK